jgi:hypothetical protein
MAADMAPMATKAAPAPAAENPWSYRFVGYGWLTALNGTQTGRGRTVDIDATFIDILEKSNSIIALMGYFEARKGPVTLFGDIVYADLTASGGALRSRQFTPHISGTLGASLGTDYQQAIFTFGAAYEVARWYAGGSADRGSVTTLDVLAGGRYWWQKVDINLDLTGTINLAGLTIAGNRAVASSGSVSWMDPFVGLRLRHQFAPGHALELEGDIGGFGAGSKFSWELVGTYSWDFCVRNNVTWSAVIGYRALAADYEKGFGVTRFEYDIIQHGPLLGVSARF